MCHQGSRGISDDDLVDLDGTIEWVEELGELFDLVGHVSPEEAQKEIARSRNLAAQAARATN